MDLHARLRVMLGIDSPGLDDDEIVQAVQAHIDEATRAGNELEEVRASTDGYEALLRGQVAEANALRSALGDALTEINNIISPGLQWARAEDVVGRVKKRVDALRRDVHMGAKLRERAVAELEEAKSDFASRIDRYRGAIRSIAEIVAPESGGGWPPEATVRRVERRVTLLRSEVESLKRQLSDDSAASDALNDISETAAPGEGWDYPGQVVRQAEERIESLQELSSRTFDAEAEAETLRKENEDLKTRLADTIEIERCNSMRLIAEVSALKWAFEKAVKRD